MNHSSFSQLKQASNQINQHHAEYDHNAFLLLRLFHHIQPRIIATLNEALQPHHLQHNECAVLLMTYAAENQQILPSILSHLLDLTRTSLTRLSDDLVNKGLLIRQENRQDRRQIILQLSKAGKQCVQTIIPIYTAVHRQILAPFSHSECQKLKQLLEKLLHHLNQETMPNKSISLNFHRTEDTYSHYYLNLHSTTTYHAPPYNLPFA